MDKFMCKIEASVFSIKIDSEGAVKLVLEIPSNYKDQVIKIPTEKRLAVGITEFEVPNETQE